MVYPNDDNGDALRRMEAQGDDLSRARDVDFTVVFPTESAAEEFAEHFRNVGHTVSIALAVTVQEHPWDVIVVKNMVPSHEGISSFERTLEAAAIPLGGRNDGWGCFSVPGGQL